MKNLNALTSSGYVGLRVAKSFTISKIECYSDSIASHRFVSRLFAAKENQNQLEVKK
jgi:hypothetical protein